MNLISACIITLIAYAVGEGAWLWTMSGHYSNWLLHGPLCGKSLRILSPVAVVLTYILLAVCFAVLVLRPIYAGLTYRGAALGGAAFGGAAYGVYNLTNVATLPNYSWTMVCVDTAWGTSFFAFIAVLFKFLQ